MPRRNTVEIIITSKDQASPGISRVANVLQNTLAVALGNLAAQAIPRFIGGIKNIAKESVLAAARVQELGLVTQLLGQRAGHTSQQVDEYVKGVTDAGIRTDVALKLVAEFSRRNLDLAKSVELAAIAQDAAVLAMEDSSQTLDGLLWGISTYNKRILRTKGLNVDIQGAFERLADQLGKNAEELTEQEKVQATLNAVLEEGKSIAGVYAIAMEAPGKQLRSLSRHVFELTQAMGKPFLDAFGSAVGMTTDFVKSLRGMVDEGGALHPVLQNLGAVMGIIGERTREASKAAMEAGTSFLSEFGGRMQATAENALRWGIKITTELATGLIRGAVSAMTAAMTFIGNLLASWLGPGSPPKVAPNIDEWGAAAFSEYLRGFGEAEFDILEDLQSPLQSALSALVQMGELGAEDALPIFRELSAELTAAIDAFMETGEIGTEIFDRLTQAGGEFGTELAELARRQFDLAGAVREVQLAEEALETAREAQEEAQESVSALMDEYNALLAAGADPAILKAKKKEFETAKKQLVLAEDQVDEAEKRKKEAEGQLDPLKEQVKLQERLLRQLILLAERQGEIAGVIIGAPSIAAGADVAADIEELMAGLETIEAPTLPAPDFSLMNEAFETAKLTMTEKFAGLFAPLTTAWEEDILPTLELLGGKWDWFTGIVKELYDERVKPVIDAIIGIIPEGTIETIGEWGGAILVGAAAVKVLSLAVGALGLLISPIVLLGAAVVVLAALWTKHGGEITKTVEQIGFITIFSLNEAQTAVNKFVDEGVAGWSSAWADMGRLADEGTVDIREDMDNFVTDGIGGWELAWQSLSLLIGEVWTEITDFVETGLAGWELAWGSIETAVGLAGEVLEDLRKQIAETLTAAFKKFKTDILDPLTTAFNAIKDAIGGLITRIGNLVDKLPELKLPDFSSFLPGSPTPFELGLRGISEAMQELTRVDIPAFRASIGMGTERNTGSGRTTNNYFEQTVNTRAPFSTVIQDFETMAALAA